MTTKGGLEKIRELVSVASIASVRLVGTAANVRFRKSSEVPEGTHVQLTQSSDLRDVHPGDTTFFVLASVEATLVPPDHKAEAEPLLSVQGTFELEYRLPEGFKAKRDELETFAELNATFNAWPYMREYVQAVTTRMAIPPVTLPLFKMPRQSSRHRKQLIAGEAQASAALQRRPKKTGGKV
jgi:hypothetical protein